MQALICDDYGGVEALRLGELPDPEPGPAEVLVRVESATVNFADTLMVKGQYQLKPDPPFAPGYEVAGTVLVANRAAGFSSGDRVCGFLWYGGMAENAVLEVRHTSLLASNISSDVGATLPGGYGTAYHALVDRARLLADERLLVLGAAGGVGMAAVQIGKVLGAEVVAAVSSNEKATFVTSLGADHVLRYDQTPLREAIADATDGKGVDVVFDPVGGDITEQALRSTNWGGRVLVIGFASGDIPAIPTNLTLLKGNSIVGVFWGRFSGEEPHRVKANQELLIDWVANGKVTPVIQRSFALSEGRDALRWVADRRAIGRVVVNP